MMGQHKKTTMAKRTLLLVGMMAATLVTASGIALAVSKVCPSGTTQANPCSGTSGIDNLVGTGGVDYIKGLGGNDKISAGGGDDTTDGGAGNDTYSYKGGWGVDTLIDSGGTDTLNFSAMEGAAYGVQVHFIPQFGSNHNYARDPNSGARVNPTSGTVVEKVTGSSKDDTIVTGAGPNTLQPGPGTGGAALIDQGGRSDSYGSIPVSNDTYSGFAASGYGQVGIEDHGGTGDKLVLPFASTDAYFEAVNDDGTGGPDNLLILTSSTDSVEIYGQLEPWYGQKGHIEQIQFTDETITIGSENPQAQALSAEAQVEKLNGASKLDEAEKQKRKEAAKKLIEEAKKEKAQDNGEAQQQSPSSPSGEEKH